jgi:hypothetical protein
MAGMLGFTSKDGLGRHSAVLDAEFLLDQSRTRLAILLSRTNHASLDLGQIALVK